MHTQAVLLTFTSSQRWHQNMFVYISSTLIIFLKLSCAKARFQFSFWFPFFMAANKQIVRNTHILSALTWILIHQNNKTPSKLMAKIANVYKHVFNQNLALLWFALILKHNVVSIWKLLKQFKIWLLPTHWRVWSPWTVNQTPLSMS